MHPLECRVEKDCGESDIGVGDVETSDSIIFLLRDLVTNHFLTFYIRSRYHFPRRPEK